MSDLDEENADYKDENAEEENTDVEEENTDENPDVEEKNADVEDENADVVEENSDVENADVVEQNANVEKKNPDDLLDEDEKRILSTIKDAIKERQLSNVIALLSPQDKEIGLLMAAKTERLATLIELVVPGANVNCEDKDRNNVLHILLNTYQNEDEERSRDDLLLECVDTLIYAGADINKVNKENKTPILTAIDKDMLEVVIHMLDGIRLRTVEPNIHMGRDARSGTLNSNTLCYLLSTYRDLYNDKREEYDNESDPHGEIPTRETDLLLNCVGKLVDAGVDVNSANEDGDKALLIAAEAGMFKVVMFLLDNGAMLVNKNGNLLHIILRLFGFDAEEEDIPKKDFLLPCVAKLVDAGVDLNEKGCVEADDLIDDEDEEDLCTPLMMAAMLGLYEVGLYLADHAKATDKSELSNLFLVLLYGYGSKRWSEQNDGFVLDFIDKLVRAGLDIDTPFSDDSTLTPLVLAVKRGMLQFVLALIDRGIKCPNYILCVLLNKYRITGGLKSRDDLLLKCIDAIVDRNNTNLHYRYDHIETPLLIAARRRLIHVVMRLIDHGVKARSRNNNCSNALQIILGRGEFDRNYKKEIKHIGEDLLLQCVVKLVEAGASIGWPNDHDCSIMLASSAGWLEITIYLLDRWIGDHPVHKISQDTMLHILLKSYRPKDRNESKDDLLLGCVVLILEAYSEVNVTPGDEHVDPPLMTAARKGLLEVVMYLVDQGVGVNCLDTNNCNLLHILLKTNRINSNDDRLLQCVRKLDEAGINLNQMNLDGNAPVMIAAKRGLLEIVRYLIDQEAAVHYINSQGKNLFHILKLQDCSDGYQYTQIVKTLIKMGLEVNQSDNEDNTPLYYTYRLLKDGEPDAMLELRYTLINLFINAGCNVNHQNKAGENLLMFFIKNQAPVRVINLLIGHGTDLDVIDNKGDTACSYCVKYHIDDGTKVFKLLVESGTHLISSKTGVNLLHQILMYKRYQIFLYYMGLQLIVGGTTVDGETMNHLLAKLNYSYTFNAFSWLLNGEIDINQGCLHNTTPMMIASFLFNRNYLELLTQDSHIDTNLQNDQGHTALHLCIIGFTILKEGFNKRHTGDEVITLCKQIYPLYMECVDILIGSGINVNIQDNSGKTALMLAAMKNDRVLIKKLLAAGAVVDILDYSGRSALQYLDIYKSVFDLTCFKLLLERGNNTILDIPCIDGNTIIQTVLCFPYFWDPRDVVMLVKYLVAENCCLQRLETTTNESSFKLIDLDEFRDRERDRLRQLLYISGAPKEQVLLALDFGDDNTGDNNQDETFYSRPAELFHTFSSNLSLKSLSRRIIRQHLGLGIKEKIKKIDLPRELYDFLLLNDILDPKYFDVKLFDDGLSEYDEDDFVSYDVDQDRDDDYSQFNYEYFTLSTDDELRTLYDENCQVIGQEDDDKNDADDSCRGDDDNDDDDDDVDDADTGSDEDYGDEYGSGDDFYDEYDEEGNTDSEYDSFDDGYDELGVDQGNDAVDDADKKEDDNKDEEYDKLGFSDADDYVDSEDDSVDDSNSKGDNNDDDGSESGEGAQADSRREASGSVNYGCEFGKDAHNRGDCSGRANGSGCHNGRGAGDRQQFNSNGNNDDRREACYSDDDAYDDCEDSDEHDDDSGDNSDSSDNSERDYGISEPWNDDHNREESNGSDDNRKEAVDIEKGPRQASVGDGNNRRAETDYDAGVNQKGVCGSGDDKDEDDDDDKDEDDIEACRRDDDVVKTAVVKADVSEAGGRDDDGVKAIFSDSDDVVNSVVSDDDVSKAGGDHDSV